MWKEFGMFGSESERDQTRQSIFGFVSLCFRNRRSGDALDQLKGFRSVQLARCSHVLIRRETPTIDVRRRPSVVWLRFFPHTCIATFKTQTAASESPFVLNFGVT